ncbi:hypothetical protein [Kocuria palustris]|uniref:hypothetical protein n=1 Tax=Kocuria palustris TaxID=71999 RepID=UPI000738E48B|nr:hypothetical protein [Kocuria palustris]KUG56144.1 hypothetical protein AVL60_04715 [Kocuria palustris]
MPALTLFSDLVAPHTSRLLHDLARGRCFPLCELDPATRRAAQTLLDAELAIVEHSCLLIADGFQARLGSRLQAWLPGVLESQTSDHCMVS